MKLFASLLLPVVVLAQSYLISNIPLPKTYVQNLEIHSCDETCMQTLLAHEQIFTFLAYAQDRLDSPELNDAKLIYTSLFNLGGISGTGELKIALLLPYPVIGRYAHSTTNAVFAYMLTRNDDFEIKTFQVQSEQQSELEEAFEQIAAERFHYVIAPLTIQGASAVAAIDPSVNVYFPTINRRDLRVSSESLFFGGIDYRAQTDALLRHSEPKMAQFYDQSALGEQLRAYTEEAFHALGEPEPRLMTDPNDPDAPPFFAVMKREAYSYPIQNQTSNLKSILKENTQIQDSTVFLNTPIVKSGMVMSQLTLYDANETNILSTQINYDPLLLSITQYQDRENMLIANSIGMNNTVVVESNALLGNDIRFDWINYATTVGIDYFYHLITGNKREYPLTMRDRQVEYPIELIRPSYSRFIVAGK